MNKINIEFNNKIKKLFRVFKSHNKELYLVGGAVRDMFLGKTPKDFDFSTNAHPKEVLAMFDNTIPTGIDYGTVTILIDNEAFEVTTYRKDHDYDSRRPKVVSYSETIEEDLMRRDFTINAMAMDSEGNIIDLFSGKEDLKKGIIKFVGNAKERVIEDRLRVLRGIRFSTVYDFNIDKEQYEEVFLKASNMDFSKVSPERFVKEFNKILCSKNVRKGLKMLKNTGLLEVFIPEIKNTYGFNQRSPFHNETVFNHLVSVTDSIENDLVLRLSAFLHDIGKPNTFTIDEDEVGHFYGHEKESAILSETILKRLRYSNDVVNQVCHLILSHMVKHFSMKDSTVRRFIRKVGNKEVIQNLESLMRADEKSSNNYYKKELDEFYKKVYEVYDRKEPLNRRHLVLDGNMLMNELGLKPGKKLGKIIKYLTEEVIENPKLNQRDALLELAKNKI